MVWATGTACAALLATGAVSFLGDRITNPDIKPISRERVDLELAAAPVPTTTVGEQGATIDEGAGTTTGTGADGRLRPEGAPTVAGTPGAADPGAATPAVATAPGAAPVAPGATPGAGAGAVTAAPSGPASSPTTIDDSSNRSPGGSGGGGSNGGGSGGGSSPGGPAPTTTAPAPTPVTQVFVSTGGTVSVTCTGSSIKATSTPAPGWQSDGTNLNASDVDVKFRQDAPGSGRDRLRIACVAGAPVRQP